MRVRNVEVNASTFYTPGGVEIASADRGLSPGQACKKLRDVDGHRIAFRAAYGKNRKRRQRVRQVRLEDRAHAERR